jgi:6-pyruvoyltetrahydropterin/6-carboxytetrahydropterin synthase
VSQSIAVEHTFEAGHRLPHVPGKCQSLHGHSWRVRVDVSAPGMDERGMVVEFGPFKNQLREWIDVHLDHGLMLGHEDPLVPLLTEHGKVHVFTGYDYDWPTVENTGILLARIAQGILTTIPHARDARVSRVEVRETSVNSATWTAPLEDQ